MKKTMIVGTLGVLLGVAAGTSAQAQTAADSTVQKPISIKIGAFIPNNGTLKNATHNTWITAGADYAFTKSAAATPTLTSVYFDYAGSSNHGGNANLYAVGVAEREYFSPTTNGGRTSVSPYAGLGVGAYFSNASGGGTNVTNTSLGGKLFLGAELNSGPFIEAAYTYLPQSFHINGYSLNYSGFNVDAGYRF